MDIKTHKSICQNLCGKPIHLSEGNCQVEMVTSNAMIADDRGLVHGGFIFGMADYSAMLAVNHSNVVLGTADVKFFKPVRLGDILIAEAKVERREGRKSIVRVDVKKKPEHITIFGGVFICYSLDQHIFSTK
jgi:uncharacterized protein (TIGR00369 family)